MFDASDLFDLPKSLFLGALRVLWWLAYDFLVQTIGWSAGWLVLRLLTLGSWPRESITELHQARTELAFFVEMVGLITIASLICLLSGHLPRL
ncbi:MAG: hypothetical protein R3E42_04280 [Burkholderiaceae bacterium]